jgi:predicted nucleic acid-binding protein
MIDFKASVLINPFITSATKIDMVEDVITTDLGFSNLQMSKFWQNSSSAGSLLGGAHLFTS